MSEFNRKIKQDIFVIMPFTSAPKREQKQLDSFFENNLKKAIEEHNEFENNYRVYRSNDTFNISNSIINSLASADIVICDLSGKFANPNVMYELGVRMTLSNKPVVLIREEHPDNKRIFDVAGYYTFQYDVLDYEQLKKHLIRKIRKFETGEEVYKSAVLQVLGSGKSVEGDDLARSLYVFRNLKTMVFSQLSFFVERFSRYVNQFIKVSISTTSDLPKIFLPPRRKKFENLDYSKFKWRFEYFHLVDHLMADNSLLSAIPFSLSSLVKKY
jgi:nucleoside 2-deoxyribosyltransferase